MAKREYVEANKRWLEEKGILIAILLLGRYWKPALPVQPPFKRKIKAYGS